MAIEVFDHRFEVGSLRLCRYMHPRNKVCHVIRTVLMTLLSFVGSLWLTETVQVLGQCRMWVSDKAWRDLVTFADYA